jgi:hypothetical protein
LTATALILGAAVYAVRGPRATLRPAAVADDTPAACIARLLSAEERGDARDYLDCFAAGERENLETLWQGRSDSQRAAELQSRFAGLVGRALTDLAFPDPDHAALILERISKDHIERQQMTLVRTDSQWQIATLSTSDWKTPAIPYGTPVFGQQ